MEYVAEVTYKIEDFENLKNSIQAGLFEIQKDYPNFDISRDGNGVTTSIDFITSTIKLKPLPDNMPEEMKNRIIALFMAYG